jgi:hypothetical protein
MKYLFSCHGGSGGTHLIECLKKRYRVDAKPDTFFVPHGDPFTSKGPKVRHQLLDENGLAAKPLKASAKAFSQRTGFIMDRDKSIADNLLSYVERVRKNPKRTAVFNSLARLGFLDAFEIPNVVFLVRHPLVAYASYVKRHRHFNLVKDFGGANQTQSIEYFARLWNGNVGAYLNCSMHGAVLLRYEHMHQDAKSIPGLAKLVKSWDCRLGSTSGVTQEMSDMMRRIVHGNFIQVYDEWSPN